LIPKTWQKITN